jgi:hypothetical protein
MKFDYYKDTFSDECTFQFTLTGDETRKVYHQHNLDAQQMLSDTFEHSGVEKYYKMLASIELIRQSLSSEDVDLGINYKKKYDELVELLEPHKIDESMEPATTLKMILKYNK